MDAKLVCQTVGVALSYIWIWQVDYAKLLEMDFFFPDISFYKLAKHKIFQVKYGTLLELL
jgi:hypothetical protein